MTLRDMALLVTLAMGLATCPLAAQNAGEAGRESRGDMSPSLQAASDLIQAYRFHEAAATLAHVQAEVEGRGGTDEAVAALQRRARLGAEMLRGTERVVFVDSLVVPLANLTDYARTGAVEGRLMSVERWGEIRGDGATVYINGLSDKAILALPDSAGTPRLAAANRIGGSWEAPEHLPLPAPGDTQQDYAFLMADGATLYYAAKGEGSLGGYDIYVTRYDTERKAFLKPENMGMPFSSPANDLLFIIDEASGIGCFATDRGQAPDSVCIYYFLPNPGREVFEGSEAEQRNAARITSIAATQTDSATVAEALRRLADLRQRQTRETGDAVRIVINDQTVYTDLGQFSNEQARRIATRWLALREETERQQRELERLRLRYAAAADAEKRALRHDILRLERSAEEAAESLRTMEKNFRKAELGTR